jgi:hypothetical protein
MIFIRVIALQQPVDIIIVSGDVAIKTGCDKNVW